MPSSVSDANSCSTYMPCNVGSEDPDFVVPATHELTVEPPEAPLFHKIAMTMALLVPFGGVVAGMWLSWARGWFDWTQLTLFLIGYVLTGLGITIGYHRLCAHRSFETYLPIRMFWMTLGALALQKSPIDWCSTHRKHHALSDRPGDPHSPHEHGPGLLNLLRGFWHAHAGWLMTGHLIKTEHKRYVPDLLQDPVAVWIHHTYDYLWIPLSFLAPAAISWAITGTGQGALMGLLWGGCARMFLVQHITFSINSLCHMIGTKEYQSFDESRNILVFGIIAFGEGFHNNHHSFPSSARHGLQWWQFDFSWCVIRAMQLTGLAWNIKVPSAQILKEKRVLLARYSQLPGTLANQ